MPPGNSPPIPFSFTPQYREQQQARARAIAQQQEANALSQAKAQQEQEEQQRRIAQQQDLYNRYNRGEVTREEFTRLQNYPLGQRDRSAEDYINYLGSYNKPIPSSVVRDLPQSGRSETVIGRKSPPPTQGTFSQETQGNNYSPVSGFYTPSQQTPTASNQSGPRITGTVPSSNIFDTRTFQTDKGNFLEYPITSKNNQIAIVENRITPIQKNQNPQIESDYNNYTSKYPLLNSAEQVTNETDNITRMVGNSLVGVVLPFQLYRDKNVRERTGLITTQVASFGSYFVPYYGEIKIGSDILTQVKRGQTDQIISNVASGVIIYGVTRGVGKSLLKAEEIGVKAFGESKFITKSFSLATKGIETSYPVILAATESGKAISYQSSYSSNVSYNQIQSQVINDSRSVAGINLGYSIGQRAGSVARESIFLLQGKTFIPIESIGDPSVVSGAKTFPEFTGAPKQLVGQFQKNPTPFEGPGGYTATTSNFNSRLVVGEGTAETPGIYIAPTPSIYFLRIKPSNETSGVSFTPNLVQSAGSPLIARVKVPVQELPGNVKEAYDFGSFRLTKPTIVNGERIVSSRQVRGEIAFKNLETGKAFVSPQFTFKQKAEAEAIIVPRTILQETRNQYFTKVYGEAVPIREFESTGFQNKLIGSTIQKTSGEYYPRNNRLALSSSISSGSSENTLNFQSLKSSNLNRVPSIYYSNNNSRFRPSQSPILSNFETSSKRYSFNPSYSRTQPPKYLTPTYGTPDYTSPIPVNPSTGISYEPPKYASPPITEKLSTGPPYRPPKNPPTYKSPINSIKINNYSKPRRPGFLVQLFRKGKPIGLLQTGPLTREQAIAAGSQAVDTTILRSFKILQASSPARPSDYGTTGNILRLGKRDKQLFVERSRFAISTRGEKGTLRSARQNKNLLRGIIRL